MLEARSVGNIRHNYCFGVCVLLIINICDAISSFGLRQGANSIKGAKVDIICDIGVTYKIVYFERFDTSNTRTPFTTCNDRSCQHLSGYNFTQTATSVIVTILELQRYNDEKWWVCRDKDGAEASFYLTVYTEPTGLVFSSSKPCDLAKESCSFTCQTSSCTYPAPSFHWYYIATVGSTQPMFGNFGRRNGSSTDNCNDGENKYNGQIMIPMYTTFSANQAKTISLECRIQFYTFSHDLKSQPSDPVQFAVAVEQVHILPEPGGFLNIVEDNPEPIICITSGSRPASTVTWLVEKTGQGTRQLGAGTEMLISVENDMTVTNSTLMFRTTRNDQGWKLSCQAVSFGRNMVSASNPKELNILYPTSVMVFSANKPDESPVSGSVTVDEHEDVTGKCQVDSNPASAIEISEKDKTIARADNSNELSFQILNTTCLNNGVIMCKGWNGVQGSTAATKILQLNVKCSPRQEYDTDPDVVARQGASSVMSLSILAYPAPSSHAWHRLVDGKWIVVRNSANFLLTSSSLQYNLTVVNVTRQLYGSYNLTLANGIGSPLKFTFSLQNKGKPEVPIDISVSVASSTSITVKWTAGYDGEVQQRFYIQYKSSNAQNWNTVEVADRKSVPRLSVDINSLQPSTDYMLRIFSTNAVGNSSLSETLTFRMRDPEASSLGAIIGGVVGGIVVVCLIIICSICIYRRNLLPKDLKTKVFGQRSTTQRPEVGHDSKLQQSANECSYAVVNKTPKQDSLVTKGPCTMTGKEQVDENYVNQGFQGDKNNSKTKKKHKPAKPEKKQQAPKNLSHDGLQYADLSFDNTDKSEKHQKPTKLKPPEGVIYDAVHIGVVGDAYYSPQNERNESEK